MMKGTIKYEETEGEKLLYPSVTFEIENKGTTPTYLQIFETRGCITEEKHDNFVSLMRNMFSKFLDRMKGVK